VRRCSQTSWSCGSGSEKLSPCSRSNRQHSHSESASPICATTPLHTPLQRRLVACRSGERSSKPTVCGVPSSWKAWLGHRARAHPSVESSACCQAAVREAACHPACRINPCQGPSLFRYVCRQKIRPDQSRDGRSFSRCRLLLGCLLVRVSWYCAC
jgi:hypothetical protein